MACKALWWSNFWVPFSPLHSFSCLLSFASLLAISWAFQICSYFRAFALISPFLWNSTFLWLSPLFNSVSVQIWTFSEGFFLLVASLSLILLYFFQIIYKDVLLCSLPFPLKWQFLRPGIIPILHILSVWNNAWHINAE